MPGASVTPLVSIVVNNFNYGRFLPRSLDSALSQSHARTEVVAVDDASTDGSRDVLRGYEGRVITVLQERNRGQGAAFHAGFRASRGDIVVFLDADDYLYPHAAARIAGAFGPGVAKVHYRLDLVDRHGRTVDLYPAREVSFDSGDVVPLLLSKGRYEAPVTSGNAFARGVLERILPMPEEDFRISADGYVVTLAPLFGAVASIDEPLGAYVQHGANAWAPGRTDSGERFRRAMEHDRSRLRALARVAGDLGLRLAEAPELRDHVHLTARLASLRLDPARHPAGSDTRLGLALLGLRSLGTANLPRLRRAVLAAWFLLAGLAPRPIAERVIAWRLVPGSRPPRIDRFLKSLRRGTA